MADTKISNLPAVTTPLSGTESIPVVQGGVTKQAKPADLLPPDITENGYPVLSQLDIGTDPGQVPLNQHLGGLAYQNPEAFTVRPAASANPHRPGYLTLQLTNDTTLIIKVKGSDGVIRSATLTLA